MICRRDHALIAALLLAVAGAGCGDAQPAERPPLEAARSALGAGEPIAAEAALRRALDQGAAREDVAALMGEAALARGDLAAAHKWLDDAGFSPATRALGLQMTARLALADNDEAGAERIYGEALAAGESASLWIDIARLRYRIGNHFAARDALARARALDARTSDVVIFEGQALRDTTGPAGALAFYRQAGADHAAGAVAREYAATLGDAGQAGAALRALSADDSPRAAYLRAVVAARGGDLAFARRLLQRSDDTTRSVPAARLLAAVLDLESGNAASAESALADLASEQPDNMLIRDLWAAATSRSQTPETVVARFSAVAAGPRGSAYLRTLVGRALEASDDREAAAAYLDLAANAQQGLAPLAVSTSDAVLSEEIAAVRTGGTGTARTLAQRHAGSADAAAVLGDALAQSGNAAAARSAYARAAMIRAGWPLLLRRMAVAASPAEARALLSQWLAGHPASAEAAAMLADAAAARGQWQQAALLLDHALANGMARVPWVNAARSVAARHLGDEEGALAWALEARALQPMNRAALSALLAALPASEKTARAEIADTLQRLPAG